MAKSGGTWLAWMERQLMHLFGPADVKAADSQRPAPPPPHVPSGEIIPGELAHPDRPGG